MPGWFQVATGIVALAVVATIGLSAYIGYRVVHPDRSARNDTPATHGLAYDKVEFDSDDGLRLAGWWIPAGDRPRDSATVVFLHGYTQSKAAALDVVPFLHAAGYNVFAFDFRDHGESAGDTATLGTIEVRDARAAVRYVSGRGDVDAGRGLHLLGWSQGGAMAIMVAADHPEITSVISDSGFATLHDFLAASIPSKSGLPSFPIGALAYRFAGLFSGADLDANSAVAVIGRVRQPLMLIQGMADPYTLPVDADLLAAAATQSRHLVVWKVPAAGHLEAVHLVAGQYQERVLAFLAQSH